MADQTVSVDRNMDDAAINGLANGDNITIDTEAILTINSDSRWGKQAAVIGNITISDSGGSLLIDGRDVWWAPFDGGTGTIPALGTAGTLDVYRSGNTVAEFLGVWTALGIAPSASGGAMPATGYIKFRSKNTTLADNDVLTDTTGSAWSITINSSTGGQRGWISVVAEMSSTLTGGRLGNVSMYGDWFEIGTHDGTNSKTFQAPIAEEIPALWVETGSGTGIYEIYLNAISGWSSTYIDTDAKGKFFDCSTTGLITFGSSAAHGYVPASGCKIRIPNILISNSSSANWNSNFPAGSIAWTISIAGDLDISIASGKIVLSGFSNYTNIEYFSCQTTIGNILSYNYVTIDNIAISGVSGSGGIIITGMISGGIITNSKFAGVSTTNLVLQSSNDLEISNCYFFYLTRNFVQTTATISIDSSYNITISNNYLHGNKIYVSKSDNIIIENTNYTDLTKGTTSTSNTINVFYLLDSENIVIDGLNLISNGVLCRRDICKLGSSVKNLTIKNIGTRSSPFDLGAQATGILECSSSICSDVKIKRVYMTNIRVQNTIITFPAFVYLIGMVCENVWFDVSTTGPNSRSDASDAVYKGCGFGYDQTIGTTAGEISSTWANIIGTHFYSSYKSTTSGHIGLIFGEKSVNEPSASSYIVSGGTPQFTGTGILILNQITDEIIYTWSHYIIGYTAFQTAKPVMSLSGTNNDFFYDIDVNDGNGFTATYKNFYYHRAGGGGTGAAYTITMTSTTGVSAGDYVWGTNVGTNAKVVTVDTGTQVTVNVANAGTVSGTLVFGHLPNEMIDPADGFKLKIKITCNTASSANTINGLMALMTTTSTAIDNNLYPLHPVDLTITVLDAATLLPIQNAVVYIEANTGGDLSAGTEILKLTTDVSGIALLEDFAYTSDQPIIGRVRKGTSAPFYKTAPITGTITEDGFIFTAYMVGDS